jgi:hypothetical protein
LRQGLLTTVVHTYTHTHIHRWRQGLLYLEGEMKDVANTIDSKEKLLNQVHVQFHHAANIAKFFKKK